MQSCPPPPHQVNPITDGAGDASGAWNYRMGTLHAVDFSKPAATWNNLVKARCAAERAMRDFVVTGHVRRYKTSLYVKESNAIFQNVVCGKGQFISRAKLPRLSTRQLRS